MSSRGDPERAAQAADVLLEDVEELDGVVLFELEDLLLSVDLLSEPPLLGVGVLLDDDPRLSVR